MLKVNTMFGALLLAVAGCASPVVVEDGDVIVDAVDAVLVEEAPLTICATEVTALLEPTITQLLRAGFAYWGGERDARRYRVTEPGACDVPVALLDEASFPWPSERTRAAAVVVGELTPGNCRGVSIAIRESKWAETIDESWQYTVLFHEIGHVVCKPHVDDPTDIMHRYGAL